MSNKPMKLVVVGAAGRMGQTLIRLLHEIEGVILHAAIEREGSLFIGKDAGEVVGIGTLDVKIIADPQQAFLGAEGVLDFTNPIASVNFANLAAQTHIVHVIGTTGCSREEDEKIKAASSHTCVIKSGNMSLGVNLLSVLVTQASRALPTTKWDIEVVEMHHKFKEDAPSGTALLLGEAAAKGREIELISNIVKVRDGYTGKREAGTIGFATLRGGSVVGDHSVIIAGEGEIVTLSHRACDRSIFARGAIAAALWGRNKKPGYYDMLDVLGLPD